MNKTLITGVPNESAHKILMLFEKFSAPFEIILFGSRAKQTQREGSDIDLSIKSPQFSQTDRLKILEDYDELFLPWKLDLVVYKDINEPKLKEHIDRVGIVIHSQS